MLSVDGAVNLGHGASRNYATEETLMQNSPLVFAACGDWRMTAEQSLRDMLRQERALTDSLQRELRRCRREMAAARHREP